MLRRNSAAPGFNVQSPRRIFNVLGRENRLRVYCPTPFRERNSPIRDFISPK